MSREEYMSMLVTIIVLFCASGTGIYGSLDSGMSGDHTILISKSILDFFTAMIFGGTLGMVVAAVAIPQCVIFLIIFAAAKFIFPLFSSRRHDPSHGACDAGELVLGKYDRTDAVKQKKCIILYFSMFQYIILKIRNNRCLINILQSCHVEESFPGRSCNLYD